MYSCFDDGTIVDRIFGLGTDAHIYFITISLYLVQIVLVILIVLQIEDDSTFVSADRLLAGLVCTSVIDTRRKVPVAVHFGYVKAAVESI